MRTRRSWILAAVLILPAFVIGGGATAEGLVGDVAPAGKVEVDESLVYLGNPARFKKAAEIVCDDVFREIPEYKKLIEEGLTEGVRYDFLLLRANQKFRKALRKVSRQGGFDLIAEVDAVRIEGKVVPEITRKVIDALPK